MHLDAANVLSNKRTPIRSQCIQAL